MSWWTPAEPTASARQAAETKCANCKMPIERGHDAVEKGGRTFCCEGCAYGGPCVC
jgi:hypothetical protein